VILIDYVDRVFSRLTVISREPNGPARMARWLCRCSCGTETIVTASNLRSGHTRSCGCLSFEVSNACNVTHGQTRGRERSPEYRAWQSMWYRCTNSNTVDWPNYGGRGIRVCPEWRDFTVFLKHVGPRPASWMSLDRIDVNGNYESGNVRWATPSQQRRNQRRQRAVHEVI
jgi:hypothetical protein